jgi:hypothetical protein
VDDVGAGKTIGGLVPAEPVGETCDQADRSDAKGLPQCDTEATSPLAGARLPKEAVILTKI